MISALGTRIPAVALVAPDRDILFSPYPSVSVDMDAAVRREVKQALLFPWKGGEIPVTGGRDQKPQCYRVVVFLEATSTVVSGSCEPSRKRRGRGALGVVCGRCGGRARRAAAYVFYENGELLV